MSKALLPLHTQFQEACLNDRSPSVKHKYIEQALAHIKQGTYMLVIINK